MDVQSIRDFVNDSPAGVIIEMIDGTTYRVPHRDYIWFTPAGGPGPSGPRRFASSFYVHADGTTRLVNTLLVTSIRKLDRGSQAKRRKSA